ncbi:MAG: hypothetical protein KKB30_15515 [Proteobacteria bacterium]|nr:hypothetical protein [Pseudomonadota bacterium]
MKTKEILSEEIFKTELSGKRKLIIEQLPSGNNIELHLQLSTKTKCFLHWGIPVSDDNLWQQPAQSLWPANSVAQGKSAIQSPFTPQDEGMTLILHLGPASKIKKIAFVLFFPEENRWENNKGVNFIIPISKGFKQSQNNPLQTLKSETGDREPLFIKAFSLTENHLLAAAVSKEDDQYTIQLITNLTAPLFLHWGLAQKSINDWQVPPPHILPEKSVIHEAGAARSLFTKRKDGLLSLTLHIPVTLAPQGISCALFQPENNRWHKDGRNNIFLPVQLPEAGVRSSADSQTTKLADEIIQVETGKNSWTLMHRFNLCHDLLERVRDNVEGLAMIFVWLRYSATRQLTWQRNYNTQPRELSHAQQRLTLRLVDLYLATSDPACRELLRLILSTVGRGGEGGKGQQIRDVILQIMHRHRIKEVTGHFMEEWHQKLHNNATPDDIVICEAYLAFLHSDGNLAAFYTTLEQGGITRERMRTFERPIVSDPDFPAHLKEGLSHDFEQYLNLLKSIFSATDLLSSIEAAQHHLDHDLRQLLWEIWHNRHRFNQAVIEQVEMLSQARQGIRETLGAKTKDSQAGRELLYLDLALEEYLRTRLESVLPQLTDLDQRTNLLAKLLRNMSFSYNSQDLLLAEKHWQWLNGQKEPHQEWALAATAVLERCNIGLGQIIDLFHHLFQSKAEYLGQAISAPAWTIELFTQEVLRGGPAFVLSQLLGQLMPQLRKVADLGPWQLISQQEVIGRMTIADLATVQAEKFKEPTILLSAKISGEEEIPPGITGVITSAGVDVLSHVAVRARNSGIFFATCYDAKIMAELQQNKDTVQQINISGAGQVTFSKKGKLSGAIPARKKDLSHIKCRPVSFTNFCVTEIDFNQDLVGSKSMQLKNLRGRIPAWLHLPRSIAIPFCSCEQTMAEAKNQANQREYDDLLKKVDHDPGTILPRLRSTIKTLTPPSELLSTLEKVMIAEGFELPENKPAFFADLYARIQEVWASKWTERAYWSRKNWQIDHDCLVMAVLIQEVVPAEYAFVIHTANPFSGDRHELYGEVVVGLGETLCSGNYAGRALSFTGKRDKQSKTALATYPSKSQALFGGGIIARSDSNGEDLENYAGAGLYESVLVASPTKKLVDYPTYPLISDKSFRNNFLSKVAEIGYEVEKIMGGIPQDVEGAWVDDKFYVVQTRPQVGTLIS